MVNAVALAIFTTIFYFFYRYTPVCLALQEGEITIWHRLYLYAIGLTAVGLGMTCVIETGRAILVVLK